MATPPLLLRVGALAAAVLTLPVIAAAPAHAHGADAPAATNYRTTITNTPDLPGLEIITVEAGARLQLTNHSGQPIEVLGYSGEPYLEFRPDGVYENVNSPATYLNITLIHVDPPANANPSAPPQWRKVSDQPRYRWHDQRALWTSQQVPEQVAAAPYQQHELREWAIPLRTGVTGLQIVGTLSWEPPPNAGNWWTAAVAGALVVALLGLVRDKRVSQLLGALVIGAGALSLWYAVAREREAGNETAGAIFEQLVTVQIWPAVAAVAAIAAGAHALARRSGADLAVGLGGTAVALFAGMVNAAVFHRAIVPVLWQANTARTVIVVIMALGGGAALAAMLRMRREAPRKLQPVPGEQDVVSE